MIVNCKDYNALMIMRCGDVSGALPQSQGKVFGSKDIVIMLMKLFFENGARSNPTVRPAHLGTRVKRDGEFDYRVNGEGFKSGKQITTSGGLD
ncbi:hypothetical protein F2Q70_00001993 [Brassica cretica]|uniref:Uncharacterized protein n=1 Tax=Brassica cretica TaxID=69181 RepID=A0A8S9J4H9_BRACR|nr:hypothetical protein F2Q70_00001993 [Brassica cretica]